MLIAQLVEFLARKGEKDAAPNARGNDVTRLFLPDERYTVDFADDFTVEGWKQFDTAQDACYFGVWVNRRKRLTLTYAEGDWVLVACPTRATYRAEVEALIASHEDGFILKAVGAGAYGGTVVTEYRQDRKALFLDPIDAEGAERLP